MDPLWSSSQRLFQGLKRNLVWNHMLRRYGQLSLWLWKTIYLHYIICCCHLANASTFSSLFWNGQCWVAELLLNADVIWLTGEYKDREQNSATGGRSRGTSEHCDLAAERWSWCQDTGWGWRLRVSLRRFRVRFRMILPLMKFFFVPRLICQIV